MIKLINRLGLILFVLTLLAPPAKAEFAHAYCANILSSKLMLNLDQLNDEQYRELLVAGFDALSSQYPKLTIGLFQRPSPEADKLLTQALGMPMTTHQFYELLPHTPLTIPQVYRRLKDGTLSPRHRLKTASIKKRAQKVAPLQVPTAAINSFDVFAPVNPPEVKPSTRVTSTPLASTEYVRPTMHAPPAAKERKKSERVAASRKLDKSIADNSLPPVEFEPQYVSTDQEQRDFVKRILTSVYKSGNMPNMAYLYTLETRADPDLGSKVINGVMYGYSGSLYDALVDAKLNPRQVFDLTQATRPLSPGTLLLRARQAQTFRKPPELLRQTAQAVAMEFTYNDIALTRIIVYEVLQHPNLTPEQLYLACEEMTQQPIEPALLNRILRDVSRNRTLYAFLNHLMHSN